MRGLTKSSSFNMRSGSPSGSFNMRSGSPRPTSPRHVGSMRSGSPGPSSLHPSLPPSPSLRLPVSPPLSFPALPALARSDKREQPNTVSADGSFATANPGMVRRMTNSDLRSPSPLLPSSPHLLSPLPLLSLFSPLPSTPLPSSPGAFLSAPLLHSPLSHSPLHWPAVWHYLLRPLPSMALERM